MTESQRAPKRTRLSLTLTPQQEAAVTDYLTLSTCFWNFLMHHLRNEIDEYIKADGRPQEYARLLAKAKEYTAYVTGEDHFPKTDIDLSWELLLTGMRDLPPSTIHKRTENLLDALKAYAESSFKATTARRPRAKTDRSAQAVSFIRPNFSIEGTTLLIDRLSTLSIEIPELKDLDYIPNEVLIGKRAAAGPDSEAKYGPQQDKYFVNLSE